MAGHTDEVAGRARVRWISVRIAGAIAITLALALLPYRAIDSKSLAMLERMKVDVANARERLAAVRAENRTLRRDIDSLQGDPRAIEEFARRDLGMTRPGELLIRFVEGP